MLLVFGTIGSSAVHGQGTAIKTDASWARTPAAIAPSSSPSTVFGNNGVYGVFGKVYTIPQSIGKAAGANLFHSFETFSVGSGDAALFTTSSNFNNVISRVSGSSATSINGLLALLPAAGTRPNFFFINPNGITFGAGAQVDVPAGLHLSTANQLRFADGILFKAGAGADSTLSIAPAAAFGFLSTTRAPITVAVDEGSVLSTTQGPFSLIAGDVHIERGLVATIDGGDLRVAAVGWDAADIPLTGPLPPAHGNLNIVNGGSLIAAALGDLDSGNIAVSAGNITIDGTTSANFTGILTTAFADTTGNVGRVSVAAAGTLSIVNGTISSEANWIGTAGSVTIEAGRLTMDGGLIQTLSYLGGGELNVASRGDLSLANGSIVRTVVLGPGDSGALHISAGGAFSLSSGSQVATFNLNRGFDAGNAGAIRISAGSILLDAAGSFGETAVFSQTDFFTSGSAGTIDVFAAGDLTMRNGATVVSRTGSFGDGGAVNVTAGGTLTLLSGAEITTYNMNLFAGNAGPITVSAPTIVIDGTGAAKDTGISSQANPDTFGAAGDITISASRSLSVLNGGLIVSSTATFANGGAVTIIAGDVTVDAQHSPFFTGISTSTTEDSAGNAGPVSVHASGNVSVLDGGLISSESFGTGNAGPVKVSGHNIRIDGKGNLDALDSQGGSEMTGISTNAELLDSAASGGSITLVASGNLLVANAGAIRSRTSGTGGSGDVSVTVTGDLSIDNDARIISTTFGSGNAGGIAVAAGGDIWIANDGHILAGTFGTGNSGDVLVTSSRDIVMLNGGKIASSTLESTGNAGAIVVTARNLTMDNLSKAGPQTLISSLSGGSQGKSGDVDVRLTGDLSMTDAQIGSRTVAGGDAANVRIHARNMTVDGKGRPFAGVFTDSQHGGGNTGNIDLTLAGQLTMLNGALISASTFSASDAGAVRVQAQSITLDGRGSSLFTGIGSDSEVGATGNAGHVEVSARGDISVLNNADISSGTSSPGNAGDVSVTAGGKLALVNGASVDSSTFDRGNAGTVNVHAASIEIDGQNNASANTGILAATAASSSGYGGNVTVTTPGALSIVNGGGIASSTSSIGNAGSVTVQAGTLTMNGHETSLSTAIASESTFAFGDAGNVDVVVAGQLSVTDAIISSSAQISGGNAGSVHVSAGSISLIGRDENIRKTGITALAGLPISGDAGDVTVEAGGTLSLTRGAIISTSTASASGRSGSVLVDAGTVIVDGKFSAITAAANQGSAGETGTVTVTARQAIKLSNGGTLSIRNDGNAANPGGLSPTLLSVSAPSIVLSNASITAQSTDNVSASGILVSFGDRLTVDPSEITTSAKNGNGGSIRIEGPGTMVLDHSRVTTSVEGAGNGGDITIRTGALVLETGVIQANTGGAGARGGNIAIDVRTLVASGSTLFVGGAPASFVSDAFGLNVIQAAAPNGISGNVNLTTPALDIAGTLRGLSAEVVSFGTLGKDLCRIGASSSLTPIGRGGLRAGASGMIRPEGRMVIARADAHTGRAGAQIATAAPSYRCEQ
jgi:filamentous hemagglutinin family protein